jgi:hypothetical protein
LLTSPSPFRTMIDAWSEPIIKSYTIISDPNPKFSEDVLTRTATIAEKIGMEGRRDLYRMFILGGLLRALDQRRNERDQPELKSAKEEVERKIREYDNFFHEHYEVVAYPIRSLVGLSLGAILHATEFVKSRILWYH